MDFGWMERGKVQDFACGCGARLGYHLTSACEVCEATPQRWFLCPRCVEAEPRGIWEEPKALPQPPGMRRAVVSWLRFGAESKPMPLSELNGREKGKSELERREKAVCEKEEQLRQRELRVQRQEEPKDVQKKALQQLAAVSSQAQEAEGRVQEAAEQVELAAQGRLEFSQRLAEKRKELEKWQQALEEKSRALEQLERSLTPSWGFPNMGHMHLDAVNIASVAGKAMVGFTFAASKVVIAMARPVVGAVRIASSAAVQFGLSSYAAAVAKANEEAQERAIAEAVHLRRMKYMASPGTMTSGSMSGMAYPDGTGVPPRTWQRPAWSPGWQASPIYPASPAPLPPVMEREGILGWIRRNSGCGTRSHHRAGYPIRYPTSR